MSAPAFILGGTESSALLSLWKQSEDWWRTWGLEAPPPTKAWEPSAGRSVHLYALSLNQIFYCRSVVRKIPPIFRIYMFSRSFMSETESYNSSGLLRQDFQCLYLKFVNTRSESYKHMSLLFLGQLSPTYQSPPPPPHTQAIFIPDRDTNNSIVLCPTLACQCQPFNIFSLDESIFIQETFAL